VKENVTKEKRTKRETLKSIETHAQKKIDYGVLKNSGKKGGKKNKKNKEIATDT